MEPNLITFIIIECDPVAWKAHAGFGRRSFNPLWREREFYQDKIKGQYNGPVVESQIGVEYVFHMKMPESASKKKKQEMISDVIRPTKRPDVDNLKKYLSDCLQGIVFKDDSQIVHSIGSKFYAEKGRTTIKIWEI